MIYCLDTSVLIEGQKRYPIEHFPSLWDNLSALAVERRLVSSEEVLLELERKEGDVVHAWALLHAHAFLPLDEEIQREVTGIMSDFRQLVDARTGKSFADPFVIATARVRGCTVVTEETGGSLERPKIPIVCKAKSIPCFSLLDLIRREKWTFR